MTWPFRKKTSPFKVTVHLDGRHPYLDGHELDYETRDITLTVPASSWADAENKAFEAVVGMKWWKASVVRIERYPQLESSS